MIKLTKQGFIKLIELIKERERRNVQKVFLQLASEPSKMGDAVASFIGWCLEKDCKNQSFQNFAKWVYVDAKGKPMEGVWTDEGDFNGVTWYEEVANDVKFNGVTWEFFFGYGNDYERFADDWVDESEREDYISFARG